MNPRSFVATFLALILIVALNAAGSDFMRQFEENYRALDSEILSYLSTKVDVTDFVYKKDRATFTFKSGTFYLVRHVNGRPTAAIFIGHGHCSLDPVVPNERNSLEWCSGSSVVDESFESCFIRFADDLDKELARFPSTEFKITWKEFNTYKQAQGEYYFRPVTFHEYDNYFQLLRSVYERQADGYLWIDFNRYVVKYDPTLPEPLVVAYEHEGGEFSITEAVSLEREDSGEMTNYDLSMQKYPTTCLARSGSLRLTGMTGENIEQAAIKVDLQINRDSLKFVSMFLHYNLDVDSILCNGQRCDFWRRGDFTFLGVVMPEYHRQGETVDLTIFYHGRDYTVPLPFVKDPTPSTVKLDLYGTTDFDYFIPGKVSTEKDQGRFLHYTVAPEQPYRHLYFQAVSTAFDTLTRTASSGAEIKFLKSDQFAKDKVDFFTPDDKFEGAVMGAFDYYFPRLGTMPTTEPIYVYPESTLSSPGLVEVRQTIKYDDQTGDLFVQAGTQVSRQWFGLLMKPVSDRELWCTNAFTDYLGLRYCLEATDARPFFSQLVLRQHVIERANETSKSMPPGAGDRSSVEIRTAKGSWIVHMLRYLMFDIERPSEVDFLKFVREVAQRTNESNFTNKDLVAIAEKYRGEPLDWFFNEWLFDYTFPEYKGDWKAVKNGSEYNIVLDLNTANVRDDYQMPVWVRVVMNGENKYFHPMTKAGSQSIELGPLSAEPSEVIFNEFLGVLCKADIRKK